MATREQLFAWGIRAKEPVDLGDGMSFSVRQLNAGELEQSRTVAEKLKDCGGENIALCVAILCRSAINEDGSRIFLDGDEPQIIQDFAYQKLTKLVDPVFRVNGLLEAQAEETAKN